MMLVTCENCESRFKLDDNLVKESGSKVRCSNCQHVFTVYRPAPVDDVSEKESHDNEIVASDETEEPLDFDLFESDEEQDDELSLEDFGLEENPSPQAGDVQRDGPKDAVAEEEITAEDLGFDGDSEKPAPEIVEPTASEELEPAGLSLEGLELEDAGPASEPPSEEASAPGNEEMVQDAEPEDDSLFDELALEEEPEVKEAVELSDQQAAVDAGSEDEIGFEDLSLEDEPVAPATEEAQDGLELQQHDEDGLAFEEGIQAQDIPEQMADDERPAGTPEDFEAALSEGVPVASLEDGEEAEENAMEMEDVPPAPMVEQASAKKGVSMPLFICLVVVLLGGGAYAAFSYLKGDIKLPFLESLAGPGKSDVMDPGNLHISLLEDGITGGFVENKGMGRLFVIKGKVKSSYPETRNFIRLRGVLYFKDGKVAKDQIVYCGNVLSQAELQTMGKDGIKKKLNNRFGDNKSNFRVQSEKKVPFMVVFSDLPEDIGEFSVEVVDSVPG